MANQLSMSVILSAVDRVTAPLRGIQSQVQRTSTSLRTQQRELRSLNMRMAQFPTVGPLSRQQIDIQRRIETTTRSIAQQERALARLNRIQGLRSRGQAAMTRGSMQIAGGMVAGYGASRMLAPGIEFDKEMSRVQGLTRLDKTSDEMKMLRQQARDLGATTWADPTQVAQGQGFLAMAGFSPQDIKKAMPGMVDLARSSGIEIARAADISSNILSAFNIPADQMDRVGDILVGTFTRANVDMEMLGNTMKYVAPIAKELGISLEETAAMAGILGNAGIQDSNGGTAMRSIFKRLAGGSATPKMARDALKSLKINTRNKKGDLRNPSDILTEVFIKTSKMGNAERLAKLVAIAGTEAGAAMATMVSKGNLEKLITLTSDVRTNFGENAKMAKVMADNFDGDLEEMKSAVTDFQITLQTGTDGALRDWTQGLTGIINKMNQWAQDSPEATNLIIKLGGGAMGLAVGIGAINVAWGLLSKFVLANPLVAGLALMATAITMVHANWDSFQWAYEGGWKKMIGMSEDPSFMDFIRNISGLGGNQLDILEAKHKKNNEDQLIAKDGHLLEKKASGGHLSEAELQRANAVEKIINEREALKSESDQKKAENAKHIKSVPALLSRYGKYTDTDNAVTTTPPPVANGTTYQQGRYGRFSQPMPKPVSNISPQAADDFANFIGQGVNSPLLNPTTLKPLGNQGHLPSLPDRQNTITQNNNVTAPQTNNVTLHVKTDADPQFIANAVQNALTNINRFNNTNNSAILADQR